MLVSPHHLVVLGIAPCGFITLDFDRGGGSGSHSLVLLRNSFFAFRSSLIFVYVSSAWINNFPLLYSL